VDPQVPLTHVMLARDETPRLLTRALFRFWMTSRSYVVQVGILLAVTLGAALVLRSVVSVAIFVAVLVLTPALLYVRCQRSARAYAPPGFTLGLGLGATHLAIRHAVATTVTSYAGWQSVERRGDVVILCTRRGGVLPLPAELVLPALAQLQALVGAAAGGPTPAPRTGDAPLPHAYECTRSTRSQLARAATIRQLLTPSMLVLVAVELLLLVSPLVLRGMPWFWAVIPAVLTLVLVATGWWIAWRRLAVSASPGMVIRAGLRDDALVLEDPTGRATISYRGVDRLHVMRNAVMVRSQLRSVVLFPRAVLPDVELRRAQSAVEWFRSRR
jgi:NADH:ubiquinone oxidoreductase subunit 3 (subunit A)